MEPLRLSLVLPTLNEVRNLPVLFKRIRRSPAGIPHEVIVADDASTDGTADKADELRADYPEVRVLRRTSNFGLSLAILDGFQAARGGVLGVMDADLQHDPRVMPNLLQATETTVEFSETLSALRGARDARPRVTMARFPGSSGRQSVGSRADE